MQDNSTSWVSKQSIRLPAVCITIAKPKLLSQKPFLFPDRYSDNYTRYRAKPKYKEEKATRDKGKNSTATANITVAAIITQVVYHATTARTTATTAAIPPAQTLTSLAPPAVTTPGPALGRYGAGSGTGVVPPYPGTPLVAVPEPPAPAPGPYGSTLGPEPEPGFPPPTTTAVVLVVVVVVGTVFVVKPEPPP